MEVLRRRPGDSFDAGVVNGPRGKATLDAVTVDSLHLSFAWHEERRSADPITLIVGLPRPQTARDILRDATTLGVSAIQFVRTAKGDANYAQSTLWSSGEWRRHLVNGAEQAFDTRVPEVTFTATLRDTVASLDQTAIRIALDNYESTARLGECSVRAGESILLAIGGERGWSGDDRTALREHGFTLFHLGPRVLRTETATVAALAIIRSKIGLI